MTLRGDAIGWAGSVVSTLAIIGTFIGWLPYIAAFAAFVWYVIQIFESRTIQQWHAKKVLIRRTRKIAKLRAREKVIAAQLEALLKVEAAKREAKILVETVAAALHVQEEEEEARVRSTPPTKS